MTELSKGISPSPDVSHSEQLATSAFFAFGAKKGDFVAARPDEVGPTGRVAHTSACERCGLVAARPPRPLQPESNYIIPAQPKKCTISETAPKAISARPHAWLMRRIQ